MKHFLIKLIFTLLFFFLMFDEVYADCAGGAFCYIKNALGVCDNAFSVNVCGGLSFSNCEAAGSAMCECGVMHGGSCNWADTPCTCSWDSWSSCYISNTLCLRDRIPCTCNPSGCGSCTGDNYEECAATACCAAAGTCTTNCGANASVPNGSCGTTSCACIECTALTPLCGQTTNCSGTVSNADDGSPSAPTCSNLGTVEGTPQTISWTSGGALADTWKYSVNGGAAVTTTSLNASVAVNCGTNTWQAMAENTSCGTDDSAWSGSCSLCRHCPISLGNWTTCDANHKRTRTCTENDGTCDGDECGALGAVGGIITEDCVGTITGTLFDASDLSTACPVDVGTNPLYFGYRYKNQPFAINGPLLWPPTPLSVSTDTNGIYTRSVFTGSGGTYQFNYDDLYAAGVAESVKTECGTAAVSLTTQGETVTKNTGFWRVYAGWWQAVGGSVYAKNGVRSIIPASLPILE